MSLNLHVIIMSTTFSDDYKQLYFLSNSEFQNCLNNIAGFILVI